MIMIKNLESTTKNKKQTMETHKWNKDSEESQGEESTELNASTEE